MIGRMMCYCEHQLGGEIRQGLQMRNVNLWWLDKPNAVENGKAGDPRTLPTLAIFTRSVRR